MVFITTLFTLHKHMAPRARLLAPLPTRTHIHQYGHTHTDIPMAIQLQWSHLFPTQYRTHPSHLDAMDNEWNVKTSYEDPDIIQRL